MILPKIQFLDALQLEQGELPRTVFENWLRAYYTGDPFDRVMELTYRYSDYGRDHMVAVLTAPMANPAKEYFIADQIMHVDGRSTLIIWQPEERAHDEL